MISISQCAIIISEWKLVKLLFFKKLQWIDYLYLTLIGLIVLLVYMRLYGGYFYRRGIKSPPGWMPIIGHLFKLLIKREHLKDLHQRAYRMFPNEKYVGLMHLNKPIFIIRDLELAKQVTVAKFDHFVNHAHMIDAESDSFFANVLISMKDDKWREMRSNLTPAFTISRTKDMFGFVMQTGRQVVSTFSKRLDDRHDGLLDVEVLDTFRRYINDVIATSAFGLVIDSLNTPDNKFYEMGKFSSNITHIHAMKFLLFTAYPKLMKKIGLQFFDEKVKNFFRSLILNTMKFREDEKIYRPDMIHFLAAARKGTLTCHYSRSESIDEFYHRYRRSQNQRNWTDDEIVAQAMSFFVVGFDNSSNLLCFAAYELATNRPVQDKLHQEIDRLAAKKGNQISYEDLSELKYMDAVVNETMRLWPPFVFIDRLCTKPFRLPPTSENDGYTLQPGDYVFIPIYSIHRDERYFPNPNSFYPERFLDENNREVHKMTFMPFGSGPRNCIGKKYAMMVVKCLLYQLMMDIEFVKVEKTQHPKLLNVFKICIDQKNGLWLGFKRRR